MRRNLAEERDDADYKKIKINKGTMVKGGHVLSRPFRGTGGIKKTPALRGRRCNAVN